MYKLADLPDSLVDFSQGQFLQRKAKQCKQNVMHLEYKNFKNMLIKNSVDLISFPSGQIHDPADVSEFC